jgi:hypothetical protein
MPEEEEDRLTECWRMNPAVGGRRPVGREPKDEACHTFRLSHDRPPSKKLILLCGSPIFLLAPFATIFSKEPHACLQYVY